MFVLDEMITGFRWDFRGAQEFFGISADLVTFGKGMANGWQMNGKWMVMPRLESRVRNV